MLYCRVIHIYLAINLDMKCVAVVSKLVAGKLASLRFYEMTCLLGFGDL